MKSLVLNLILELSNLESEINILLSSDPSEKGSQEVEEVIVTLKNRLMNLFLTFSRLLDKYGHDEEIDLGGDIKVTSEELLVSAFGNLFLNLFLKISLANNCNFTTSTVIWKKLSENSSDKSSLQNTSRSLLEKVMELDEE